MRINRLELLDILSKRIADADVDYVARLRAADNKAAEQRDEYITNTRAAWVEMGEVIARAVATGQAITRDDIPNALMDGGYLKVYRPKEQRVERPDTAQMRRLVTLLNASPDETVSLASLERAGFVLGRVVK